MASSGDNRYGKNRNIWRRSYPYTNRKPITTEIRDIETNQLLTFDLNRTTRHRNYFELRGSTTLATGEIVDYEEGLVFFNNETQVSQLFVGCFDLPPFVTFTQETFGSQSLVNVFGPSGLPSVVGFTVATSAPYTGFVRYRAVGSDVGFPKFLLTASGSPSSSFWIYAGNADLNVTRTEFTASFTIPTGSLEMRLEAHDAFGNSLSNVAFEIDTLTASGSTGRISSPLFDIVHFQVTSQ